MNAEGGCCCCYERKGNSSGKDYESQYEEDHHRPDGSRGLKRADPGPHRYGADRQSCRRWRGKCRDRPCGPGAPRTSAGRTGYRVNPAPVGKHDARTGPERKGARQFRDKRPEDGCRWGFDACQHRGRVRSQDARRPWCRFRGMHGMGHAAPRDDVPPGEEHRYLK